MESSERQRANFLQALRERQHNALVAASDVWGYINEEAGARLLERFWSEGRIQSFVLAARGSFLDSEGVDAALHLWDQSYLPVNFKSSRVGARKHRDNLRRSNIPCLVINMVEDPDFLRASVDLAQLIETWDGEGLSFSNDMLIPCARLTPTSKSLIRLRDQVSEALFLLAFERATICDLQLSGVQPLHLARRKYGYVSGMIGLSSKESIMAEFYRGPKVISWIGKDNRVLIVLPEKFEVEELRLAFEVGFKKAKKI